LIIRNEFIIGLNFKKVMNGIISIKLINCTSMFNNLFHCKVCIIYEGEKQLTESDNHYE